jgi:hypothetical protein
MLKHFVFVGVCLATLARGAFADDCSADASSDKYKLTDGDHKYLFSFDVTSDDCQKYSCTGYVDFVITFKIGDQVQELVSRSLVSYRIAEDNKKAHVSVVRYIGVDSTTKILDVGVEKVTCETP